MDLKTFASGLGELSLLTIVCLCYAIAHTTGETVDVSVVNGSLSDLASYEKGGSLTLRCEVTGFGTSSDFTVSWQHGPDVVSQDGALRDPYAGPRFAVEARPLPGRGDISGDMLYELTISPVMPGDDGNYSCIAFNQDPTDPMVYNMVATETVTLTVMYFPDETNPICTPNGPVDVYEGETVLLRCSTDKGNPTVLLTLTGTFVPGPWSTNQGADTISRELLLDRVTSINNGSAFVCTIESVRFPSDTRSCTLGPLNVVQRPIETPTPNTRQPGDPIGALSTTNPPETPADPACRGWLIAFLVTAGVATLSIIFNVVFLTARQMKADRKKVKMEKNLEKEMLGLDEVPQSNRTTNENEVYVNAGLSAD